MDILLKNEFLFLFLLPDGVGVDRIIEPQDVQTEQAHNQSVHSRHQPGDTHEIKSVNTV